MQAVPHGQASTGVVGNRQLISVQTFDIARLTTDPVPIVPGAFDVVSGRGPKGDSNESGKTTFLAAVSLLHAEGQWRLETDHGRRASGLLFEPATAGVADAEYRGADHGYIVGVFAHPGQPQDSQLTVWMRVSVSAPYILVRHTAGLRVAHGESDQERYEQADALWEALGKGTEIGSRKLAGDLYGDAPRCIAYLDTSLRPGAPSLLSQQMTEMTPARIAEALIALTGRESMLDHEQEQRRLFSEQHLKLEAKVFADKQTRRDEDTELSAVEDRNRARTALGEGEHLWRLHFARGYLDAVAEDELAGKAVGTAEAAVQSTQREVDTAAATFARLRDDTDLAQAALRAKGEVDRLEGRHEEAIQHVVLADRDLQTLSQNRLELLDTRHGWDGRSSADAQHADDLAQEALTEARDTRVNAEREHRGDLEALADAQAGDGGPAGPALAALTDAGVAAIALLDNVTLQDAARQRWEPMLWPHRAAVVVAPCDEERAVEALAALPGAVVVAADGPLDAGRAELDGATASVPVGRFLAALTARTEHRNNPSRAADPALGEATLGGFLALIAGRAARVAAAQSIADASARMCSQARDAERAARLCAEAEAAQLASARAADELKELAAEEKRLRTEKQSADSTLAGVRKLLATAKDAHLQAASTAHNHGARIELALTFLRVRESEHATAQGQLRERQEERARGRLPYWERGWAGNADEALALLDGQPPNLATGKKDSLRRRSAESLKEALDTYLRGVPDTEVPPDLAEARTRRQQLADGVVGVGGSEVDFASVARPLRDHLDGLAERDELQSDRIHHEQARRADELSALETEVGRLDGDLRIVQDMVAGSIESALLAISARLDGLVRRRGGFGAELRVTYERPDSPAATWLWKVAPHWRRSPGGPMTSYQMPANGAQVKVFAIQLVLAALLAAEGGSGRLLVLDELGNSLGDENRKDVLADLNEVARDQNVTILGACQDGVLADAAAACGQILWFERTAQTDVYNRPTRAWGFDADGDRVEALAAWLREGRTLV
jgi:hypothetical protein